MRNMYLYKQRDPNYELSSDEIQSTLRTSLIGGCRAAGCAVRIVGGSTVPSMEDLAKLV
jgi:hypothetical protein